MLYSQPVSHNWDNISYTEERNYENDIAIYTEINNYAYFATADEIKGLILSLYISDPKNVTKKCAAQRKDNLFDKRTTKEDEQFTKYEKEISWYYHILNDGTFDEV